MTVWSHVDRAWDWLWAAPPLWSVRDLTTFLHWIVPTLIVVHVVLALISQRQQATPAQKALTRFLWVKAAFWAVVEIAFHERSSRFYVIVDWAVFIAIAVTSLDLLTRLFRRYVVIDERTEP